MPKSLEQYRIDSTKPYYDRDVIFRPESMSAEEAKRRRARMIRINQDRAEKRKKQAESGKATAGKLTDRSWKNHKWIDRKRGPNGKWIYDYGDGFNGERKNMRRQYADKYGDKYIGDSIGDRAAKVIRDITSPIQKNEIYENNAKGRLSRLADDVVNVGHAFVNTLSQIDVPWAADSRGRNVAEK